MHCFRRAVSRLHLSPTASVSSITPGTLSRSKCMPSQSMLATVRYANPVTQMRWNSHSPSIRYIQPKEKEEHKKDDPYTTPRRHSRQSLLRETTTPKTTVYVGNLFFDVTAEDLREHFEQFGAVENSVLVHDSRGMSKGFGYVTYSTTDGATEAIRQADATIFEGREVTVQFANTIYRAKSDETPSMTLYIGNLPYELTDVDLQALFDDILGVDDIRVPVDRRTGLPRGFAHVDFVDMKSAYDGKEKLSRRAPYGRKLLVTFARRKIMSPEKHDKLNEKKIHNMEKANERLRESSHARGPRKIGAKDQVANQEAEPNWRD